MKPIYFTIVFLVMNILNACTTENVESPIEETDYQSAEFSIKNFECTNNCSDFMKFNSAYVRIDDDSIFGSIQYVKMPESLLVNNIPFKKYLEYEYEIQFFENSNDTIPVFSVEIQSVSDSTSTKLSQVTADLFTFGFYHWTSNHSRFYVSDITEKIKIEDNRFELEIASKDQLRNFGKLKDYYLKLKIYDCNSESQNTIVEFVRNGT